MAEKFIVHGIGKSVFRDFKNPSKVITFVDAQDLSVQSSFSKEDIVGGNKLFPIASFKKDQALQCSLTNATMQAGILEYLDGADAVKAASEMSVIMEVIIPTDGKVALEYEPIENSVIVEGFESVASSAVAGKYVIGDQEITFATADAGKVANIVYKRATSADTMTYSVGQKSMAKPFIFETVFPVYDEDTQVNYNCSLVVFKAQCTSGFNLTMQHQAPFAPKIDFEARDAKRPDGKLWDFVIEPVTVTP